MNKKNIIIILIILAILVGIITLIFLLNKKPNLEKQLSKTEYIEIVYVRPRNNEKTGKTSKITSEDQINKIVDIILKGEEIKNDGQFNLDGAPHYRLKFYNKKNQLIEEVEYEYYDSNDSSNHITLKNTKKEYYIDDDALLDIIDN